MAANPPFPAALPSSLRVPLIGGPLDGDEAMMQTPLPLWRMFCNGWDIEEGHTEHLYVLAVDTQGKAFYHWIARVH